MDWLSILEAFMVISFGISWPVSIAKSWRSRTSKGKSLFFLIMIAFGYAAGVIWKVLEFQNTGHFRYPFIFYILNLCMVLTDIVLYFRNRRFDAERQEG